MEETAEMFNSFKERMKQRQVIQSNKSKPEDTRAKNNKGTTGGDGKHQGTETNHESRNKCGCSSRAGAGHLLIGGPMV